MNCKEANITLCYWCRCTDRGYSESCYVEQWASRFRLYKKTNNLKEHLIDLLDQGSRGLNLVHAETALKIESPKHYEWIQKIKVLM